MPKSISIRSVQTILVLAVAQLVAWGTTFDMIGVFGRTIARDLGLSNEVAFAGVTVMMIVSGLAGPATGRWLDRYGAARVLAAGAASLGTGLAILSVSHTIYLYAFAWFAMGIGAALGLLTPTFTAVVEREGANAHRIIGILMLFTGLSTTLSWPLLSILEGAIGWRTTIAACAAVQFLICVPLYLFALPKPIAVREEDAQSYLPPVPFTPRERQLAFLLLAAASTISAIATFGLTPSLLELLHQAGATPEFALQLAAARGVIGVSARVADMALGKRSSPFLTAVIGTSLMTLSFLTLLHMPASTTTLVVFILLYSFGSSVMIVARALLPLSLFSSREFGLQSARLSLPQNLAYAVTPVIFTAILDRAGSDAMLYVCTALAFCSLLLILYLIALVRKAKSCDITHPQ